MENHLARRHAAVARAVVLAFAVGAMGALLVRDTTPAGASAASALTLAEHMLTSPVALADESPYQLIDPVGPGGITQDQAMTELTSSTMLGGMYNDAGHYGGGYGQQYFVPANRQELRKPGGYPR